MLMYVNESIYEKIIEIKKVVVENQTKPIYLAMTAGLYCLILQFLFPQDQSIVNIRKTHAGSLLKTATRNT